MLPKRPVHRSFLKFHGSAASVRGRGKFAPSHGLHLSRAAIPTTQSFFTNTNSMKRDDPYAQLGLSWGAGATIAEIKAAYRKKVLELHPDLSKATSPGVSIRNYYEVQRAYETLIRVHSNLNGISQEKDDEWRFAVWRNSDRIAIERDDVAGAMRKRPMMPPKVVQTLTLIGHPAGRGAALNTRGKRGEYISSGSSVAENQSPSSSVGRGRSKWVGQKEFIPWNRETTIKGAKRQ
jgi:DnaJ domain